MGAQHGRRDFLKRALATGGLAALGACLAVEGDHEGVPRGQPDALSDRQFAWNDALALDANGNPRTPGHQLVLLCDYRGDGTPTAAHREQVEAAFHTLERAYQWGTGDERASTETRGLLFFVGYAPQYFDRFDEPHPSGTPRRPEAVIEALGEDATADDVDAVVVLASDTVSVLLAAEQALRGTFDTLNGVPVEGAFTDAFEVVDRRTGFVGEGRPAAEFDAAIPSDSPQAMGYRVGFSGTQASEGRVAIGIGPFAGGTTCHVSRLALDLDAWYRLDEPDRVNRMFSVRHGPDVVGPSGDRRDEPGMLTREMVDWATADARDHDLVGHVQKVASARDDDFEPKLLRRAETLSTDLEVPSMNFVSLQRRIAHFLEARRAMNCPAHGNTFTDHARDDPGGGDADEESTEPGGCPAHARVSPGNDGINSYVDVLSRGTYLVPPRSLRSLPEPTGIR